MLFRKYQRGFIDPLSLTALGFLVISLIVGTFVVVTKKTPFFELRERAADTCSGTDEQSCEDTPGCSWGITSVQQSCSGSPPCLAGCSVQNTESDCVGLDEASCQRQNGCSLVDQTQSCDTSASESNCPSSCRKYSQASCGFIGGVCPSGCTYIPAGQASCTGPSDCIGLSQTGCQSAVGEGCSWKSGSSTSCTGTRTTYSACSGTIVTGSTCSGRYQTGQICSGTYFTQSGICTGIPSTFPTPVPTSTPSSCENAGGVLCPKSTQLCAGIEIPAYSNPSNYCCSEAAGCKAKEISEPGTAPTPFCSLENQDLCSTNCVKSITGGYCPGEPIAPPTEEIPPETLPGLTEQECLDKYQGCFNPENNTCVPAGQTNTGYCCYAPYSFKDSRYQNLPYPHYELGECTQPVSEPQPIPQPLQEPCKICLSSQCIQDAFPPDCTESLNQCITNSDCIVETGPAPQPITVPTPTPTPPPVSFCSKANTLDCGTECAPDPKGGYCPDIITETIVQPPVSDCVGGQTQCVGERKFTCVGGEWAPNIDSTSCIGSATTGPPAQTLCTGTCLPVSEQATCLVPAPPNLNSACGAQRICCLLASEEKIEIETEYPVVNGLVYYNQRTDDWAQEPSPYGNCDTGKRACGPAIVSSLLSTYVDTNLTPDRVIANNYSDKACINTQPNDNIGVLTSYGFTVDHVLASPYEIGSFVEAGWYVMVLVQISDGITTIEHFTLVVAGNEQGELIYNDPYFGADTTLEGYDVQIQQAWIVKPPST